MQFTSFINSQSNLSPKMLKASVQMEEWLLLLSANGNLSRMSEFIVISEHTKRPCLGTVLYDR